MSTEIAFVLSNMRIENFTSFLKVVFELRLNEKKVIFDLL